MVLSFGGLARPGLANPAASPLPADVPPQLTPAESKATFQVADGLEFRLVASEPMVRQPLCITFDDRGRLWVLQYLQYPNPNGLKPVEVDQYLRTKYDRAPEPPPRGPKGADSIIILDDPDGDGRYRSAKEFVYLSVLMDMFTRCNRGWHLGRSLEQELRLTALDRAFECGRPAIRHSDQGVQYAATAYVDMLKAHEVKISMASVGEPEENGYAERLMRTIKEEEVDLSEYEDFGDAMRGLGRFLDDVYNRKRIHSSPGYLTPAEFGCVLV